MPATEESREGVLNALGGEIGQRNDSGELAAPEIPSTVAQSLIGRFADDPTLQDICDEAYLQRDAEQPHQ